MAYGILSNSRIRGFTVVGFRDGTSRLESKRGAEDVKILLVEDTGRRGPALCGFNRRLV
jgi:hypothetical protein